jgi:hypothetical protein
MGRSKAALVILIIGLVILILAPIWKWGIGPMLVKVPDTIDATSVYDGTLSLYVDPASFTPLPADAPVKVPLQITRVDQSQPAKSTGSVAVIKETQKAIGPAGKTFIEGTMYYALDRKTSENVSNPAADFDRTGFYPILPIGVEKITYKLWGDDTRSTGDAKFVKVDKVSGFTTPATDVYWFKVEGSPEKTYSPPLGLPATISGADAKKLSGNPNLAVNDTEQYPITYLKQTTAVIASEPRTGSIVDVTNTDTYFVDASALGQGNIKLASINYVQTRESVKQLIDESAENWNLLDMVYLWIPLILLIVGVALTATGGIWFAVSKPKA